MVNDMSEVSVLAGSVFIFIFMALILVNAGIPACKQEAPVILNAEREFTTAHPAVNSLVSYVGGVPLLGPLLAAFINIVGTFISFVLNTATYMMTFLAFILSPCIQGISLGLNLILIPLLVIIIFIVGKFIIQFIQAIGNLY